MTCFDSEPQQNTLVIHKIVSTGGYFTGKSQTVIKIIPTPYVEFGPGCEECGCTRGVVGPGNSEYPALLYCCGCGSIVGCITEDELVDIISKILGGTR